MNVPVRISHSWSDISSSDLSGCEGGEGGGRPEVEVSAGCFWWCGWARSGAARLEGGRAACVRSGGEERESREERRRRSLGHGL